MNGLQAQSTFMKLESNSIASKKSVAEDIDLKETLLMVEECKIKMEKSEGEEEEQIELNRSKKRKTLIDDDEE